MIYHGVLDTCNGFVYHMGAAILDLDEPWKVTYRCKKHPAGAGSRLRSLRPRPERGVPRRRAVRPEQDRLAIYYGAADTVTCACATRG